jgi:hypothetical protein
VKKVKSGKEKAPRMVVELTSLTWYAKVTREFYIWVIQSSEAIVRGIQSSEGIVRGILHVGHSNWKRTAKSW